jgi:hypothetical protein
MEYGLCQISRVILNVGLVVVCSSTEQLTYRFVEHQEMSHKPFRKD